MDREVTRLTREKYHSACVGVEYTGQIWQVEDQLKQHYAPGRRWWWLQQDSSGAGRDGWISTYREGRTDRAPDRRKVTRKGEELKTKFAVN